MPNKNYQRGRAYEYKEKKIWEEMGYFVIRSAGSHSLFDLVAFPITKRGSIAFIQVKSGRHSPTIESNKKIRQIYEALYQLGGKTCFIWYKKLKGKRKVERITI